MTAEPTKKEKTRRRASVLGVGADLVTVVRDEHKLDANTLEGFLDARKKLRPTLDSLYEELRDTGFVAGEMHNGRLTTGNKPFNVFAKVGQGKMEPKSKLWNMDEENTILSKLKGGGGFVIACNREENDENYADGTAQWKGRASMSKHHRFLTTTDPSWWYFNVLVFGMRPYHVDLPYDSLEKSIKMIETMIYLGTEFAKKKGWGQKKGVGLYFHWYGHSSVNSLHMHIVDLDEVGPTHEALAYKNLPAQFVLDALKKEEQDIKMSKRNHSEVDANHESTLSLLSDIKTLEQSVVEKLKAMDTAWEQAKGHSMGTDFVPRYYHTKNKTTETLITLAIRVGIDAKFLTRIIKSSSDSFTPALVNPQGVNTPPLVELMIWTGKKNEELKTKEDSTLLIPDQDLLEALLEARADLFAKSLPDGAMALHHAFNYSFKDAVKELWERMAHGLVKTSKQGERDASEYAMEIARIGFDEFDSLELVHLSADLFIRTPGKALTELTRLSRATMDASRAIADHNARSAVKLKDVASKADEAFRVLLMTLSRSEVVDLLSTTRGEELLTDVVKLGSDHLHPLTKDENVRIALRNLWFGDLLHVLITGERTNGTGISFWRRLCTAVFTLVLVLPLNLLLLVATAAWPPLKVMLDRMWRLAVQKGEDSPVAFPMLDHLQWRWLYLLETPLVFMFVSLCSSLSFVFVYVTKPDMGGYGVWVISIWCLAMIVEELLEIWQNLHVWSADWLNFIETPVKLFIATDVILLHEFFDIDLVWLTAIATGGTVLTQGLRLMQLHPATGPLVMMTRLMLIDVVQWLLLVSVVLCALAGAQYVEAYSFILDGSGTDQCAGHENGVVTNFVAFLQNLVGGSSAYVDCLSEADSSIVERGVLNGYHVLGEVIDSRPASHSALI